MKVQETKMEVEEGVLFPRRYLVSTRTSYVRTDITEPLDHSFDDAPSLRVYHLGVLSQEVWHNEGIVHRLNGPAQIDYEPNGRVARLKWCLEGGEGRLDFGPTDWSLRAGELTQSWIFGGGSLGNEPDPRDKYIYCHYLRVEDATHGLLRAFYRRPMTQGSFEHVSDNPWIGPHQPNPPLLILLLACERGPESPTYEWGMAQATEEQKVYLEVEYLLEGGGQGRGGCNILLQRSKATDQIMRRLWFNDAALLLKEECYDI